MLRAMKIDAAENDMVDSKTALIDVFFVFYPCTD